MRLTHTPTVGELAERNRLKIARFNSTNLGIKVQKLEIWAFGVKTSIQLRVNAKSILRKLLKAWKLFQNSLKCAMSDA